CYPLHLWFPQFYVHHRPSDVSSQTSDIPHAHRAENLNQLVMPDTDEVDQTLRSPLRVDPPRPQMMVRPVACLAFELGLQRHQYCRIYRHQVCTTNDCLGNMFG